MSCPLTPPTHCTRAALRSTLQYRSRLFPPNIHASVSDFRMCRRLSEIIDTNLRAKDEDIALRVVAATCIRLHNYISPWAPLCRVRSLKLLQSAERILGYSKPREIGSLMMACPIIKGPFKPSSAVLITVHRIILDMLVGLVPDPVLPYGDHGRSAGSF